VSKLFVLCRMRQRCSLLSAGLFDLSLDDQIYLRTVIFCLNIGLIGDHEY
jgi:hypothetical protein